MSEKNNKKMYRCKDFEIESINWLNLYKLSETVGKKFKLMKWRMKISYMAFIKTFTINELFLKSIYDVYYNRL